MSFLKKISGIEGFLNRKEAKKINEESKAKYDECVKQVERNKEEFNEAIKEFTTIRLESLQKTLKPFLRDLEDMKKKNAVNEYELLEGCSLNLSDLGELREINLTTEEILSGTLQTTALSVIALSGVPTAITASVSALASASTGTAIASLSGIAKTNAMLAWLGGGSLATGGGGVALGTTVLTVSTYAATGIVAVITTGLIASSYYSKKLTNAVKNQAEVDEYCEQMQNSCVYMQKVKDSLEEFNKITLKLIDKFQEAYIYFEPIVPDFLMDNPWHIQQFQKILLIVKSISDLAKTPILNKDSHLNEEEFDILIKTKNILNTEL